MCTCMCGVGAFMFMWKPEASVGWLPQLFYTVFTLRLSFLIRPGAHWLGQLSASSRDPPASASSPPTAGLQIYATRPNFGARWTSELRFLGLIAKD